MGIYVQCVGSCSKASDAGPAALIASARKWAVGKDLESLFYGIETEVGAWISFYPPTGGIEFEFTNGAISFGEKTSVAGPGYHAALIDLCTHLGTDLGISWSWRAGGDQTDFANSLSRSELNAAFVEQFETFCRFFRDTDDDQQRHAMNLAEGLAVDGFEGVATPLGPMSLGFFLDCLASREAAEEGAMQIFPWWDIETGQAFWRQTLLALLWSEVEWRAARTPWEEHVHNCLKAIGERLTYDLDHEMRDALTELDLLSSNAETFCAPSSVGIGYRRLTRAFFLPGPWRINLPGYYIEHIEDDGKTTCLWFGDEEIRGSSFTIAPSEPGQISWSEGLADQPEFSTPTMSYRLPSSAHPSDQSEGFETTFAEFQAIDPSGNVSLLVASVFGRQTTTLTRMANVAAKVWLDRPKSPPGSGH